MMIPGYRRLEIDLSLRKVAHEQIQATLESGESGSRPDLDLPTETDGSPQPTHRASRRFVLQIGLLNGCRAYYSSGL